jgi:Ca-activated chloride channel homolog
MLISVLKWVARYGVWSQRVHRLRAVSDKGMKQMRVGAVRNDRAFAMTLAFTIVVVALIAYIDRGCETLAVASSQEKWALLSQIAAEYNASNPSVDGRCSRVTVARVASGQAEAALARGWDTRVDGAYPDVWAPAATTWTLLLRQERAARNAASLLSDQAAPSIMQSPLVIAMPRKMAVALGWPGASLGWKSILSLARDGDGWATKGHPEWGQFRLGKTNPRISTSGMHALIGAYFAKTAPRSPVLSDVSDPDVRDFVHGVESSVVHYGDAISTFLENMLAADRARAALTYVSAIAMEEKQVYDYNHGNPRSEPQPTDLPPTETLVAVYPSEGTLMADHPYVILSAPWVTDLKRKAGAAFLAYLLAPEVQKRFTTAAFRDYLGNAGPEISPENGLLPNEPSLKLRAPAPVVIEAIQKSWSELRRKARLLVAIDVSETMGDRVDLLRTKLDLVKTATTAFDQLADDDQVALWTFSTGQPGDARYREILPMSRIGDRRGDLRAAIEQLTPIRGGGTPLYATTRASVRSQTESFVSDRINAVLLLTDGHNEDPNDTDGTGLLRDLQLQVDRNLVRVFTVGYGADADTEMLTKIARASRGAFYPAADPGSIDRVLTAVLSNF